MTPIHFDRLIVDLLIKEYKFEKALTVEHVEDTLVNKQVTMKDELSFVQTTERIESVMQLADNIETGETYLCRFVHEILGDISLVNRQRRNYRLIREWGGGVGIECIDLGKNV